VAGCLGETSALALILGSLWLFYKGHIDWRIPGGFIGAVFIMGAALGGGFYGNELLTGLFHVLAGGVLLGALFMATDMVTSPVTKTGKLIFGIGCGVITMLIRLYGSMPEGVTFGILIMNALTPIIDNFTIPRKFGEVKRSA
jgi:electron transport complex protein RnfD